MTASLRDRVCAYLREGSKLDAVPADDVLAVARDEGVLLVLADRLVVPKLAGELRHAAVLDAVRATELRRVLSVLNAAGVRPVLLKGAALAHTHYARPELRPRSDTDLMIPVQAKNTVACALAAEGYTRPAEIDGDLAIGQFHFVKTDAYGCRHAIDVHWRVSNVAAFAAALTYDELLRDAVNIPALGVGAFSPCPVHALLIACVHRVAHHADTPHLLWLYDVHLIARHLTAPSRAAFRELAEARRMRAVCGRTLSMAQDAFGEIDAAWIGSLAPADAADEPSAVFLRGRMRQADILKSDLAATAWANRFQLLREHLFPPPSYMRHRYPRCPVLLLPLAYASRIVAGAPRWLRR